MAKTGLVARSASARVAGRRRQQRALLQRRNQLRGRHAQRKLIGVAGVNAAEQRIHQPVDHPVTQAGRVRTHPRQGRRRSAWRAGPGPERPEQCPASRAPAPLRVDHRGCRGGCRSAAAAAGHRARAGRTRWPDAPVPGRLARRLRALPGRAPGTTRRLRRPRAARCAACRRPGRVCSRTVTSARPRSARAAERPAIPPPTTRTRAAHPSSWTSSTTRVSTSGSVSGRTPWPRLKMWPSVRLPRSRISRTSRR